MAHRIALMVLEAIVGRTKMLAPIAFYFDFVSPYAYIAATRINDLAARYEREVDWRPVLLGVTVMRVMGLKPLMETPLKGEYMRHDSPRMARLFGVPLRHHGLKNINSLAACRAFLALKARSAEQAENFALRIFRRLWVDSRDITQDTEIAAEAAAFGADPQELLARITSETGKQELKDAVDHAIGNGVFGVPFFVLDGEPIWGCDRLWMVEHKLRHSSWDPVDQQSSVDPNP
jgi:2-hydroxychromene-2-carboxylate isomerase